MISNLLRLSWPSRLLLATLVVTGPDVAAQGFDPGKVDWEALSKIPMRDGFIKQFNDQCAVCHGENLRGAPLGTPLVGLELRYGDSVKEIARSIADGFPAKGMPAWSETLSESQIWNLALYVAEQRQGTTILDKNADISLKIPDGTIASERHAFRIQTVATGLDPMPFSIAPLPDGRILLSERVRGLSIIGRDGKQSAPVSGTPPVYADSGVFLGQVQGIGWMLDVAIHPHYKENGWIYIHHTDRCSDCNDLSRRSKRPVSMNRLVRGRIKDGAWIDEEILWKADLASYTDTSDLAAGGRISFDNKGYVYISVGMKAALDFMGVQDLSLPYGKIHRVHDDGRIPSDNPLVKTPGALKSIWTYGHRSVQGLEFNSQTGVNYDGRPINVAKALGITLAPGDAEFPVVDLTPSPAISSFIFYRGTEFPGWRNNIIVGTLRATDLLRMEVVDNKVVHTEALLKDLARFRDIETGPGGELYVLLENATDSRIIRLLPDVPETRD